MFNKVLDIIPDNLKKTDDKKPTGTVFIGIDGMVPELVVEMANNGELPAIKSIIDNNVSGETISSIPSPSIICWSEVLTGKNPGKTGSMGYWKKEKNDYNYEYIGPDKIDAPDIFDYCREHNKKIISLDMITTFPPREVPGILVSGPMAFYKTTYTYPEKLTEILDEEGYIHRVSSEMTREDHELGVIQRFELADLLIKNCEWDIFMLGVEFCDSIGHHKWFSEFDTLKYIYKLIDKKLGDLFKTCDDNTNYIIISDHGLKPTRNVFNIGAWLIENKYLNIKTPEQQKKERKQNQKKMRKVLDDKVLQTEGFFKKMINKMLIELWLLKQSIPAIRSIKFSFIKKPDAMDDKNVIIPGTFKLIQNDKSKVLPYLSGLGKYGAVYLNYYPMNPQSAIKDVPEYEKIKSEIIDKLKKLTDQEGNKIIEKVWTKEELYEGKYLPEVFDIIFRLKEDYMYDCDERDFSEKPVLYVTEPPEVHHDIKGVFLAKGLAFKNKKSRIRLRDVFSCLCYLTDIPVSNKTDSELPVDIFNADLLQNKELKRTEEEPVNSKKKMNLSNEQLEDVKNNLFKMGYLKGKK